MLFCINLLFTLDLWTFLCGSILTDIRANSRVNECNERNKATVRMWFIVRADS